MPDPYTYIAKPTGASYTNLAKPTDTLVLGVGYYMGALGLTYSDQIILTNWGNVSKPSGGSWTNIAKPL
mgnify:CR=1 FL=1